MGFSILIYTILGVNNFLMKQVEEVGEYLGRIGENFRVDICNEVGGAIHKLYKKSIQKEKGEKKHYDIIITKLGNKERFCGEILRVGRQYSKETYIIVFSKTGSEDARIRSNMFDNYLVNMISYNVGEIRKAMDKVVRIGTHIGMRGNLICPWCGMKDLSPLGLGEHWPFYHVYHQQIYVPCPICFDPCRGGTGPHIQHAHMENEFQMVKKKQIKNHTFRAFAIALIPKLIDDKNQKYAYLMVQERCSLGYYFPGGGVEIGEGLEEAVVRETMEEAGVKVKVVRMIQMKYIPSPTFTKLWVLFECALLDPMANLKTIPDFESAGATWVMGDHILQNQINLRSLGVKNYVNEFEKEQRLKAEENKTKKRGFFK